MRSPEAVPARTAPDGRAGLLVVLCSQLTAQRQEGAPRCPCWLILMGIFEATLFCGHWSLLFILLLPKANLTVSPPRNTPAELIDLADETQDV